MKRWKEGWLTVAVLVCGVGMSLFASATVWKIERLIVRNAFERAAINRAAAVRQGFEHALEILDAFGALYTAFENVSQQQFRDFVGPMLVGHAEVQALAWVPRVAASERAAYEGQASSRLSEFRVNERSASGERIPAARRPEHFPILFLEPIADHERLVGFDLASDPLILRHLRRSCDRCRIIAVRSSILSESPGDPQNLLVFLPVYGNLPPGRSVAVNTEDFRGFALIVYRIPDLIENALAAPRPVGIDLVVFDESAPAEERFVHFHPSRLRALSLPSTQSPPSIGEATLRHEVTFPFAGRLWSLLLTPAPGFFELPTVRDPEIALLAGLAVTGILTASSWLLWRRRVALESMVRDLNREISERERTQDSLQLFQSLMHRSAEAILVADPPTGRILYANEQASRQLGYAIDELEALGFPDLLTDGPHGPSPEDWPSWVAGLGRSPARVLERKMRRKSGESLPVELSVSLVEAGGRRFLVSIAEDITVRRRKEEAMSILHQRLLRLSRIDGLTGLANRRVFDERLALEWKRAARDREPLSLIISDIDHFKLFNDRYGHLEGDDCLKTIAETLSASVARPADLVARFGGEELAVLLPGTDRGGAFDIAERMRTAVEMLAIPHDNSSVGPVVTVSFGVGTIVPDRGSAVAEFLQLVDSALYAAKNRGRNRTEWVP